jgi:large subunit ribosomal protein L25
MNKINIKARTEIGKDAKGLLKENYLPAVVYSAKGESTSIKVLTGEMEKILLNATKTTIIDLDEDGKVVKAVIKEAQRHPVTDNLLHISFFKVDEEAEMVFDIPFVLDGIAPAVKNNLGALQMVTTTLKVKCKVNDLVPTFVIDITKLERPGQTIKVSDLSIPTTIKLFHAEDIDATLVTITEFEKEEVKVEAAAMEATATGAATATITSIAAPVKVAKEKKPSTKASSKSSVKSYK